MDNIRKLLDVFHQLETDRGEYLFFKRHLLEVGKGAGYLGWANSWRVSPKVVDDCKRAGHKLVEYTIGNCVHLASCEICGYWYKYDSSG